MYILLNFVQLKKWNKNEFCPKVVHMPICLILPGGKNTISGINCYLCRNKVDMWKLDISKFFDLNVTIHLIKLKKKYYD